MFLEAMTLAVAMDVYTEYTKGAPKPRFDLPDVYYCCAGGDLIYTENRSHVTMAAFSRWRGPTYNGQLELLDIVEGPFVLTSDSLERLPLGENVVEVRAFNSSWDWIGWLADETFVTCGGDVDLDHLVGVRDLTELVGAWGTDGADFDYDGDTGVSDVLVLLQAWGECD